MRSLLGTLLASCVVLSLAGCGGPSGPAVTKQNLDRVRPGMTLAEVEQILGPGQEAGQDAPKPVEEKDSGPKNSVDLFSRVSGKALWEMLKWRKWSDGSRTYLVGFIDEGNSRLTVSVTPFELEAKPGAGRDKAAP